jgi:hypothetical protein
MTICRYSLINEHHFPVSDVQKAISRNEGETNGAKSPAQPNPGTGSIVDEVPPDLRRKQFEADAVGSQQKQAQDSKKTSVGDSAKDEGKQMQLVGGGACAKPVAEASFDHLFFQVPEKPATSPVPEQIQNTVKARSNEIESFKVPEKAATSPVPEQIQSTVNVRSNVNESFKVPQNPSISRVPNQIQNTVKARSNENSFGKAAKNATKQGSTDKDVDEDEIECLDLTGLDSEMSDESEPETEARSSSDDDDEEDEEMMEEGDDEEESKNVVNMSAEENVSFTLSKIFLELIFSATACSQTCLLRPPLRPLKSG